jgi:hypothetical protein
VVRISHLQVLGTDVALSGQEHLNVLGRRIEDAISQSFHQLQIPLPTSFHATTKFPAASDFDRWRTYEGKLEGDMLGG